MDGLLWSATSHSFVILRRGVNWGTELDSKSQTRAFWGSVQTEKKEEALFLVPPWREKRREQTSYWWRAIKFCTWYMIKIHHHHSLHIPHLRKKPFSKIGITHQYFGGGFVSRRWWREYESDLEVEVAWEECHPGSPGSTTTTGSLPSSCWWSSWEDSTPTCAKMDDN